MKYCRHCGTELDDNVKFCSKCGKDPSQAPNLQNTTGNKASSKTDIIHNLSNRLQLNGIFWIFAACFQLGGVVSCLINAIVYITTIIFPFIFAGIAIFNIVFAIIDIVYAVKSFKDAKRIKSDPRGIVAAYDPLAMPIVTIIGNFLFGGLISCVPSVLHLAYVRMYIMENRDQFLALEK